MKMLVVLLYLDKKKKKTNKQPTKQQTTTFLHRQILAWKTPNADPGSNLKPATHLTAVLLQNGIWGLNLSSGSKSSLGVMSVLTYGWKLVVIVQFP